MRLSPNYFHTGDVPTVAYWIPGKPSARQYFLKAISSRSMEPRTVLRVEGLAVPVIALGAYLSLDGPIWLLAVLALAPDLSMIGYLSGPRFGSLSYNIVHTYTLPLALGSLGIWADNRLALLIGLIWAGHIGMDRLAGYGLKFESGFTDTHLSTQPAPIEAFLQSDQ